MEDYSKFPEAWEKIINDVTDLYECMEKAYEDTANGKEIFPEKQNVFRALGLCPPDKVKVVILGQDPYYNRDKEGKGKGKAFANGLAFGTDSEETPYSLKRIIKLAREAKPLGKDIKKAATVDKSLKSWARQGVLLLNTALTVSEGEAGKHLDNWQSFTRTIIDYLKGKGVIFICWGNKAQERVGIGYKNIIYSCHPAARRTGFGHSEGKNHFDIANEMLKEANKEPINWHSIFESDNCD